MSDLASLLSELAAVQSVKSKIRLSERNVVDVVAKLKELNYIDGTSLLTTNLHGVRAFVTKQCLKREIVDMLSGDVFNGRCSMIALAGALGVELVHIEEQSRALTQEGTIMMVAGEMISDRYFETAAEEVADELNEAGRLGVAEIAKRLGLPADVVAKHVTPRVADATHSTARIVVEGGTLYTDAHAKRVDAALRGALRAAVAPVEVMELAKASRVVDKSASDAERALVAAAAQRAVNERWANGSLKGGGRWAPDLFEAAREDGAKALFAAAGAACYEDVKRLGAPDPAALLATLFPNATAYEHCRVGATAVDVYDASVTAALRADGAVDAAMHLPNGIHALDAGAVLLNTTVAKSSGKEGALVGVGAEGTCIVSKELVDACTATVVTLAQRLAREQLEAAAAAVSADATSGKPAETGAKSSASKSAAKKIEQDDDDDWNVGPKKGKGKKGKGGGGGGGVGVGGGSKGTSGPKRSSTAEPSAGARNPPSLTEICAHIVTEHPVLDGLGDDGDDLTNTAAAVAKHVFPTAREAHSAALASALTAEAEARKTRRTALLNAAQGGAEMLRPLLRGASCLADADAGGDATAAASSRRLASNGTGSQVVDALLRVMCLDARTGPEESPSASTSATPTATTTLSAADRKAAVASLERVARDDSSVAGPAVAASALVELLGRGGGDVVVDEKDDALVRAIDEAAEQCGLRLRWPDRKAEKAMAAKQASALSEALQKCVDAHISGAKPTMKPDDALVALLGLYYATKLGRCVLLPGKAVTGAVARLRGSLDDDAYAALETFHAIVTAALRDGSDVDESRAALYDKLQEALAFAV